MSKTKVSPKRKTAVKKVKENKVTEMMMSMIVVVTTVIIAPLAWYMTQSLILLFIIPFVASLMVALFFKQMTGVSMSYEFRRETTTITAVFAVILAVISALMLPKIGLDGRADIVLPIFMIIYMSLWAIIGVLVTVFLPLGITIPKEKK